MLNCLLILSITYSAVDSAHRDAQTRSEDKLRIWPIGILDRKYVVKEGTTFRVSCILQDEHHQAGTHLSWRNEHNRKIDGESSSSLFTIGLHERGTSRKKQSLIFTEVAKRDAGIYKCVASDSKGATLQKEIEIIVVDAIIWNDKNDISGGVLGESLTIDCGAQGEPKPEIQISSKNGDPLNANDFIITGTEVTVARLTKDYQNQTVKCLAIQEFLEYQTTTVEEREVRIDVWFAPEFHSTSIDRYAIVDRQANLHCSVVASNPKVLSFRFFKNNKQLMDSDKHVLKADYIRQTASLIINEVDEFDFGEYKCEASNGKAKSTLAIFLRESSPPREVRASLYKVGNTSITWKIEDSIVLSSQLPVLAHKIEYIDSNLLEQITGDNENIEQERLWSAQAISAYFNKSKTGLYEINGLREETSYVFRMRARNAAGFGDAITLTASTEKHFRKDDSLIDSSSQSIQISLITLITLRILAEF